MQTLVEELQAYQRELALHNDALESAQRELAASRDWYRELYELAPVGYLMLDRQGLICEANLTAAAMLGFKRRELLRCDLAKFIAWQDLATFRQHCRATLERGGRQSCEVRLIRPDRSIWHAQLQSLAVQAERGAGPACRTALVDITAQKRAEETLQEASRRNDAFLALLAHELRTPLAPLLHAAEVLQRCPGEGSCVEEARGVVREQVWAMARLIHEVEDASRITRGKVALHKQQLDAALVVEHAVNLTRPLIDRYQHALHVSLPLQPLYLAADPTRLSQVLSTLLHNAAQYTPEHGHIWLTVTRDGAEALVQVRDSGVGISAERLPQLFEMCTEASRPHARQSGSLGLSLVIAKRLIEMHGGTIEARSGGEGQGSEFIIRMPAVEAEVEATVSAASQPSPAAEAPRLRVLVVDDNEDSAASLSMLLSLMGHEVCTAGDGPGALQLAASCQPQAVLLDISLPGMDGYELARRLRELPSLHDTLLVALSGRSLEDDREAERCFDRYLTKPADPAELTALLAHVAQRDSGEPTA